MKNPREEERMRKKEEEMKAQFLEAGFDPSYLKELTFGLMFLLRTRCGCGQPDCIQPHDQVMVLEGLSCPKMKEFLRNRLRRDFDADYAWFDDEHGTEYDPTGGSYIRAQNRKDAAKYN